MSGSQGLDVLAHVERGGFTLHVEFTLAPGERVALIGPNGAGKSTLLSVLAGLESSQDCAVSCDREHWSSPGHNAAFRPTHERNLGLLAQNPGLFPHLTVLENVAYGPRSRRLGKTAAHSIAQQWMARTATTPFAQRTAHELSGGERQRVAIARLMASAPHTILLDEPMAGLDVTAAADLRQLLAESWPEGAYGIVATHNTLDVLALASRVICLDQGRIASDQPLAQALTEPQTAFAAHMAGLNLVSFDTETWLAFPASAAQVHPSGNDTPTPNMSVGPEGMTIAATVTAAQSGGNGASLLVKTPAPAQLIAAKTQLSQIPSFPPGTPVAVIIDTKLAHMYPKTPPHLSQ